MGNVLLGELPWPEVEKRLKVDRAVIVPIGATESYGRHLPLGTDFLVVAEIAKRLGEMTDTLVLPVLPFGDSSDMMGFTGSISLKPETVLSVLKDVCASLIEHGFTKIIFLNGHLGNVWPITAAVEESKRENVRFAQVDWWRLVEALCAGMIEHGGHAGEVGTSIVKVLRPELVQENEMVAEKARDLGFASFALIETYPEYHELTSSGVLGDPKLASVEQGKKVLAMSIDYLRKFIEEFKKS
ncbi:MAG: creatininase family protein [Candidatus Bathyarchaeia archaeon]|jgi:creatinine amidohydrolase